MKDKIKLGYECETDETENKKTNSGRFLKGHIPCNRGAKGYSHSGTFKKGHEVPIAWRENLRKIRFGTKHSEETKEKMKIFHKANPVSFWKGKKLSEQHRKNIGAGITGDKNPFYGKHHTEKTKNILREKVVPKTIARWKNKEYKEMVLKKTLKGLALRPTSYERRIIELCKKYQLPYRYVGSGEIWINGQNPDFINCNGGKIVIEVFNDYHKIIQFGSVENYKKIREKAFGKFGYKTIFIHDDDLKNKDWEAICFGKINQTRI